MFLLSWLECYNDFEVVSSLNSRSPNSIFWLSWVTGLYYLFPFSILWSAIYISAFNVFLYCCCMFSENFGYFCVEIFKHFIDIRCLFSRIPADVFYIIAQVIIVMFVVTFDCSWIVFDGVDFPHATNHVIITEGQRERWRIRNSRFVCKHQVD